MADVRKSARATKDLSIMWAAAQSSRSGRGRLIDVSLTGAQIEVDQILAAGEPISLMCAGMTALPTSAHIQWCQRLAGRAGFRCGVKFAPTAIDSSRWNERVLATT